MDAFVEIARADGSTELFPIEGEQVTLGRSGTAGISLPQEPQLELEHILLAPRGKEGCWISASQSAMTPVLMKGKPFQSGIVKWGSKLSIGSLSLVVTNKRGGTAKGGEQTVSPVLAIGLVVAIAALGYMFLTDDGATVPSVEGMEPPGLFTEGNAQCPAGQTGTTVEQAADSRADRYAYDPRDGVASVELYKKAAACFTSEGPEHVADAQRATRQAQQMTEIVNAAYAGRRLRLTRSLATEDWPEVERQSRALLSLTRHIQNSDWRVWLEQIHRISEARAAQAQTQQ